VIHPLTPLEDLERFFDAQAAAAAERNARRHQQREEAAGGSKESTPTPRTGAAPGEGDTEWDDEAEGAGHEFALVTDTGRKWVLAVATRNDLDVSRASYRRENSEAMGDDGSMCADDFPCRHSYSVAAASKPRDAISTHPKRMTHDPHVDNLSGALDEAVARCMHTWRAVTAEA
jgi:hypothetical protein